MSSSYSSIHMEADDRLVVEINPSIPDGHYMRFEVGREELTLFVPDSRAHELAVLLNKAAVYFGSVGCPDTCEKRRVDLPF